MPMRTETELHRLPLDESQTVRLLRADDGSTRVSVVMTATGRETGSFPAASHERLEQIVEVLRATSGASNGGPSYAGREYPPRTVGFFEALGFGLERTNAFNYELILRHAKGTVLARVTLPEKGAVVGKCGGCKGPARSDVALHVDGYLPQVAGYKPGHLWYAVCWRCERLVPARFIRGVYRRDIPCSAKCSAATGFDCECSCGGRNHGGKFRG